jgi:hypothetical protein
VSITNLDPYIQNFNALPRSGSGQWVNNSTLRGWYAQLNNGSVSTIQANTGVVTTAGLYALGTTYNTDRALGGFATTTTSYLDYGIRLVNNTGAPIRNFTVTFTLEQWYLSTVGSEKLDFSYRTGSNLTSLSAGTWKAVAVLNASSPATGTAGIRNGNQAGNQVQMTTTLYNVNLANGQEVLLRWRDAKANRKGEDHGLGIDDVSIVPENDITFYSKASGALNNLNNWGTNPDGTGTKPDNFTSANQVFQIQNNKTPTINTNWVVSGNNSKVVLGDDVNPVSLTISSSNYFQGLVDVNNAATLTLAHNTLPTLGALEPGSTIIIKTSSNHVLSGNTFGNLTLAGSGTKSLASNTTVAGTLTLTSGNLQLNNYQLRILETGAISGGSTASYIVTNASGALERSVPTNNTQVLFPIGNPTYTPAALTQSNTGSTDYFSARVFPGVYPAYDADDQPLGERLTAHAIDRTWIVDEESEGGSNITLNLFWTNAEVLPNYKTNENQVSHCDNGVWDKTLPKAAVISQGSLYMNSMSGISTFSPFINNSPDARLMDLGTLPVELLSFAATRRQQEVVLTWVTTLETGSDFCAIETSTDGINFQEAGRVKSAGNSYVTRTYTFSHRPGANTTTYYRLKQTDLNQEFTYSKILAVAAQAEPVAPAQVYPNPGKGLFHISIPEGQEIQAVVTDLSGKIILPRHSLNFSSGSAPLDLSSQRSGIYLLNLVTDHSRQVIRLVKN